MMQAPNIILIVLDTVRCDQFSSYGNPNATTPHIDNLIAEGIRYEHAYANSTWTLPSHASMFTGLHPNVHRADGDTRWMSSEHTTIAEYLTSFDFQSAAITCNNYISLMTNIARGFDKVQQVEAVWGTPTRIQDKGTYPRLRKIAGLAHRAARKLNRKDRGTKQAIDESMQWVNQLDRSRPFFLMMNFMESHLPYLSGYPERFAFIPDDQLDKAKTVPMDFWHHIAGSRVVDDEEMALLRLLSDGGLLYMDRQIGRLMSHLKAQGLYENSLIIITSDHGESFGEEGLLGHQYSIGEQLSKIPLVIRHPNGEHAGKIEKRLVQLGDIFPTMIDMFAKDGDWVPDLDGLSLMRDDEHDHIFVEYLKPVVGGFERMYPDMDISHLTLPYRAMIELPYKLIWRGDGQLKLYHIVDDPTEQDDLSEAMSERANHMLEIMQDALGAVPELEDNQMTTDLDEIAPQLKALGYM